MNGIARRIKQHPRLRGVLGALGGTSLLIAACAGPPPAPESPLRIPEDEFRRSVLRLCLWQPSIEVPLVEPEEKQRLLVQALVAALVDRGFEVVPPEAVAERWEEVRTQAGGYFDPHSGDRIESRYRTVLDVARAELRERLGCQATVTTRIEVVSATWTGMQVRWHGVSRPIGDGFGKTGTVSAVSMFLALHDMEGREIYFRTAGIQLLATVREDFMTKARFEEIPPERVLADGFEIGEAVRVALEPLGVPAAAAR